MSIIGSSAFVQNFVLLGEVGYFDIAAIKKPLLHIWSLGIEEQFYIFWPLVLILIARFRLNVMTIVCGLAIASFWFSIVRVKHSAPDAFYLPYSRAWELFIGSGLVLAQTIRWNNYPVVERVTDLADNLRHYLVFMPDRQRVIALLSDWGGVVGACMFAYGTLRYNNQTIYPSYHALVPVIGAVLLIQSRRSLINRFVLGNRFLVYFGLISYPLYLWHFPLMAYCRVLLPDWERWPIRVGVILVTVVLSCVTYHFVEKPIRAGRLRRYAVPLLALVMTSLCALGFVISQTNWLIPRAIQPFMLTGEETYPHWLEGCLLPPNVDAANFGDKCAGKGNRPQILLWGDSDAAALYPGLSAFATEGRYDVAQFASSNCPPILGYDVPERPVCRGNNDFVLDEIRRLRPDIVLLHSTWLAVPDVYRRFLPDTVRALRSLGVSKIVILGPLPSWKGDGLPVNVADYYYEHERSVIPLRTRYRLLDIGQDEAMRQIADDVLVPYISAWAVMCNDEGCLARVGENGQDLTFFDEGHLTVAGSLYVARAILPDLLQGIK